MKNVLFSYLATLDLTTVYTPTRAVGASTSQEFDSGSKRSLVLILTGWYHLPLKPHQVSRRGFIKSPSTEAKKLGADAGVPWQKTSRPGDFVGVRHKWKNEPCVCLLEKEDKMERKGRQNVTKREDKI